MTREELIRTQWVNLPAMPAPGDVPLTVRDGESVVANVDVYWRTIQVGDAEIAVAGIGQVITHPHWRGLGLASALIRAAHTIALHAGRGIEWAALFADIHGFYERVGYRLVDQQRYPHFMVCPVDQRFSHAWPVGEIDTRGTW